MNLKNKLLSQLQGIMFADDGFDAGGGGGADTAPAAGETSVPEGGTVDNDAGHSFSESGPSSSDVSRSAELLKQPDDTKISFKDIAGLLRLDLPPKPEAKPTPAQQPAAAAQPAVGTQPKVGEQPQQPVTPPAGQQALTPEAIAAAVKAALPQQPAAAQPANEPQAPKPFYGTVRPPMAVSEQLATDLFGEDPGKSMGAINTLVNGIMNQVMADVAPYVQHLMQQQQAAIPQLVQQQQQTYTAEQKFYQRFGELQRPAFKTVVDGVAQHVRAQWKASGKQITMSDEYFDAVGNAVHEYLKQEMGFSPPRARAAAAPAAAQQITAPASAAPASAAKSKFWTNGGARPPADPRLNGQSADLRDFV